MTSEQLQVIGLDETASPEEIHARLARLAALENKSRRELPAGVTDEDVDTRKRALMAAGQARDQAEEHAIMAATQQVARSTPTP